MKLLFISADFGGSSWYRIVQPSLLCKEIYDDSMWCLPNRINLTYLNEADMVVVQRQCDKKAISSTMDLVKSNKIIVSEIDDNLWSIPPDVQEMHKFWTKENIRGFETMLSISHAVTVSTPRLAKMIKEFNNNVYLVPNLVEFDLKFKKVDYDKIRIGWSGSDTHLPDFTPDIQLALLDIKNKYKDKVDIFVFGIVPPLLFTHVTYYQYTAPHLYMPVMRQTGLDIGIVPNRENLFNDCRSPLKWVEYSSIKAATIASNTESYRNSITNGQNGIILKKNSRKAWFNAMVDLIENKQDRVNLAENAYKHCYQKYSTQENKKQYSVYYDILNNVQGG